MREVAGEGGGMGGIRPLSSCAPPSAVCKTNGFGDFPTPGSMVQDPRSTDQVLGYSRIRMQGLCICASTHSLTQNTV
jgi:hypothetical protein